MAFTVITVTGRFLRPDGTTPASGSLSLTLTSPLLDAVGNTIAAPVRHVATLNAEGRISVPLIATDDPDIVPSGVTYQVTEYLDGAAPRSYALAIPYDAAGATVDLADLVELESPTDVLMALPGPQLVSVAAHDATAAQKRWATYVCDGEDDQEEINAALAGGMRRVLLVGSSFAISEPIEMNDAGTTLEGEGWQTVISGPVAGMQLIEVNADDCQVAHLTLDGADTAYRGAVATSVANIVFRHLRVVNMERAGLKCTSDSERTTPARNIWFHDNLLENCIDAIACDYYNENVTISRNILRDCTQAISVDGLGGLGTQGLVIEGNQVIGGAGESVVGVLQVVYAGRAIIRGNLLVPASGNGMFIRSQTGAASGDTNSYHIISDNTIIGAGTNGIYVTHPGGVRIHDNTIQGFINGLNLRGNAGVTGQAWSNRIIGATAPIVYQDVAYWDTRNNEGAADSLSASLIHQARAANITPAILRAHASQSAALARVENSNGDLLSSITAAGVWSGPVAQFELEAIAVTGEAAVATNVLPPGARVGHACTLTAIYARCGTAPTGAALTLRVNRNGTSITTVTIADGQTSGSTTGLSQALAAGDILTIDVVNIGSSTPGADVALQLIGG